MCLPDAILITRPEPGAGETGRLVAGMGFVPLIAPALTIAALPARLPRAAGIAAVLVTSGNALAACLPDFRDVPLFAVGDATAAKARGLGFRDVRSAAGNSAALADLVVRTVPRRGRTLLLVSGQGQGGALAGRLRDAGYRVARRVVYRSCPAAALPVGAAAALRAGSVRAALFFSAETVRAFAGLIRREGLRETLSSVDAFAIGAAAGVALQAMPWRRTVVAAKPTQDAMLALLR
jgi:uroporphyrinogen-III synthase